MIRMVKRSLFPTCSVHVINFIHAMCVENDEIVRFVVVVRVCGSGGSSGRIPFSRV
jgi:hypothetical protein